MANPLQMLDLKVTGFQFIEEQPINAAPATVWSAVINPGKWFGFDPDPNKWAKHSFAAKPGAQWIVDFPNGSSVLFATVALVEPQKLLRISGQMGFTHLPIQCVTIFELQPQNDGKTTLLRVGQRTFGFIDAELQERFHGAWKKLLPNIKTLAEKGAH